MRKIRRDECVALACYHDGFNDLGTFNEAPGTLKSPGVPPGGLASPRLRGPPPGLATLRVSFKRQ